MTRPIIRPQRFAVLLIGVPVFLIWAAFSPGQSASPGPAGSGSKTWVGHYQEVEEYLRTAECVRMEDFGPPTVKRCVLRPGGPVARMAWKSLPPGVYRGFKDSYKADIAAYELDKLLKMDMVPPAVERELQGHKGSATFWVEDVSQMKAGASPREADRARWEGELVRMRMFDHLIGNKDRNLANSLHDAAWNLILLDHSRAFGPDLELPIKLTRIDREFWARVQSLTRNQLDAKLRSWLDDDAIEGILNRRERMAAEIRSPLPR